MALPWVKAAVVSVPPILVSLWTWRHLTAAVAPYFDPIQKSCEAEIEDVENPLLKIYSILNCILIPFFTESLSRDEGKLIWMNFAALGAVYANFHNTEASRLGTRFPLYLVPLYTCFFMFIGVSIAMPLLWLPVYFLLGMPESFPSAASLKTSWYRVWLMWALNFIYFVAGIAPFFPWALQSQSALALKLMLWVPCAGPFLYYLAPVFKTSNAEAGQQAVIHMHAFTAGLALTSHAVAVLFALSHPAVVPKLIDLLSTHEGGDSTNYFLLIDIFVFWGAMVYQILVEGGLTPALLVVLATPVLGIGAPISFYYMHRESLIFTHHKGVVPAETGKHRRKRKDA